MIARKRTLRSNLAKVDSHVIAPEEYEDSPELTEADFARAVPHVAGKRVSKAEFRAAVIKAVGRPRLENPKKAINLRLDADVVAYFRATGPGWQTRINAMLRRVVGLPKQIKAAAARLPNGPVKSTSSHPSRRAVSKPAKRP
jgi:uncharacterized protein (DUF4415 family)